MNGPIEIGVVEAIFRYPVKSMRGEALEQAELGWHGIDGDRRFGLRRRGELGGMPWLTASKLAELVLYTPELPAHVRTPAGEALATAALEADIGERHGAPVELMHLRHGIFDEDPLSIITTETVGEICRLAGVTADVRRFRPNVLLRVTGHPPFGEDAWVGGALVFGDGPSAAVTRRDLRCAMVNIDPDDASRQPQVMKVVVGANDNHAGVYANVTRTGRLEVGQRVVLQPPAIAP